MVKYLLVIWRIKLIKQFYYINQYIRADQLRVISENGTQLGVLSKAEALKQAQEKGVDLVLVAANANPPVAKIIDFSKFKFQQEKKEQSSKKKSIVQEVKELRLSPFIAQNDLRNRVDRAKRFLKEGDKVRLVVWFRGRQITKKQYGYDLLKRATEQLSDFAAVDLEPKLRGKNLELLLRPLKKHETNQKTKDQVQPQGAV